ncbi:MAG TPA: rod shape-determining protein MreC [Candidatus Binataceae bacterium]|nr:rod shape-determining protein MreC [Candidatus Binataceae bacterium]
MKGSFLWRNRVVLTGGALIILSLYLMTGGVLRSDRAAAPARGMLEVLRPVQAGTANFGAGIRSICHDYLNLVHVRQENERLTTELARVKADQARMVELEEENRHLAELLELRDALGVDAIAANVIGSDATGISHTLVLGQGSSSGLKPGMAVLSNEGVVGRIIETSAHASRVLLIDDHNSALDGIDQRSRARGIVAGMVDDGVIMKYVDRGEDIKADDTVVTSGLDGIFPRGLLVGSVAGVHREGPGLFLIVQLTPAVHFHELEQVLVVRQQAPQMNAAQGG